MRRTDHLLKTMTAVRSCISNCRRDSAPLVALESYLQELRHNPDWTKEEVAEVECAARRVLQPVTGPSSTNLAGTSHF